MESDLTLTHITSKFERAEGDEAPIDGLVGLIDTCTGDADQRYMSETISIQFDACRWTAGVAQRGAEPF